MLKQQIFSIDGITIKFENHNDNGSIEIENGDLVNNKLWLPLPQFRKLMDILSKTKFMFSNENK